MLNIITGPARSGKSENILRQIKALAVAGKRSILIVPESYSHSAERRMLELCGDSGGRYARVVTFSKLCRELLREGGLHPRTLDAAGRVLYMYLALTRCQTALDFFKGAPKPQLLSKLLETVDELVACRVSPEALLRAAADNGLHPKIRDVAVIYSAFQAEVEAGGLDSRDPFDMAVGLISKSEIFRGANVFIDGFSGFTAQRREALARIAETAGSLTVALLLDEADEVLFTRQAKTRDMLKQTGERAGVWTTQTRLPERENAPLARLARATFFRGEQADPAAGGAPEIYSCSTPHEECELAAALSRRLVLRHGARAREIAVLCPDMDGYAHMLENAFARYGVPLFVSAPEDVLSKPPVMAVLSALYAVQSGFTRESVLDWLRTGLAGVTAGQCDLLENYSALWNLRGGRWFEEFELSTTGFGAPAKDEDVRLFRLNRIRALVAAPLDALRKDIAECKNGRDFAGALVRHLQRTRFEKRLARRVRALEMREPRISAQYAQLFGAVMQAIAQLDGALGEAEMDLNEFTRLLRLALGRYEVDVIPVSLDCAQASAFERLDTGGVRHVFILGAREGALPPASGGTGLLSESERVTLETSGIELTLTAEDMAFENQSNIYRAMASCESLTFTAPRTGADGEEHRASYIIERVKTLSGVCELDGGRALARLALSARIPAFESACRAASGAADAAAEAARGFFAEQSGFFAGLSRWIDEPRPKITRSELIRGLYGDTISMTASRVEHIASCRFSYFMRYGLKAEPMKRARLGAPEMGSFVHEVVERSMRDLSEKSDCTSTDMRDNINTLVQYYINTLSGKFFKNKQITARTNGIFVLLCECIIAIVQNAWQEVQSGDFKPLFFELGFGSGEQLPALAVEADGIRALIRGKIDRVDGWRDGETLYIKVVDYKTGKKSFRLSDVYYGLNMQMFIYLLMLGSADRRELLRLAGCEANELGVGGALYIPAKSPWIPCEPGMAPSEVDEAAVKALRRVGIVSSEPRVLAALEKSGTGGPRFLPVGFKRDGTLTAASSAASAKELEKLISHAESLVARLAREIADGDVRADPYRATRDFTYCQWCDYAAACHFDEGLSRDRHRYLKPLSRDEVFEKLNESGEQNA